MTVGYHHGDLPNALRAAAAELIVERGPAGFSLREVARRAGVSHAAPAHHFGDTRGLLTSVAIEGFEYLRDALASSGEDVDDPAERLVRLGVAYVEVAQRHPGHCALIFRKDLVDPDDADYVKAGEAAFAVLVDAVTAVRDRYSPELDVIAASFHCWATTQGLLDLYDNMVAIAEMYGLEPPTLSTLAEQSARLTLGGLLGR